MRDIEISREPIELYKVLKLGGLASSGGEAKMIIEQGLVSVNGSTETQKRKKIVSGDTIACREESFQIRLTANPD